MNLIRFFKLSFILFFLLVSCNGNNGKDEPVVPPDEDGNVTAISEGNKVIYEVNLRNYSAGGNFAGLTNDLPRLQKLGIDILWLMPIHPIGEKNRNGSKGSPYAVKDYKAINPDYGTAADLKALISAAHTAGMEIWLDWVGNHTAWDHAWTETNPDFYASLNGVRPYSPNGWTDVIQLDYNNAALRTAMIDAMKYWVTEFNIDGFRCDAATFIPVSFWEQARTEIDKVKKLTWLCEGDKAEYMKVFDYDYAWAFNTALNEFGKDRDVTKLISECNKLFSNVEYSKKGRMVYLTNHDLNAYDGTEFTRYGNALLPLTALSFTIYDMPLIYNGQEIGMNKVMGLFDISPVQWTPVNATIDALIKKLTRLRRTQPALESGSNRGTLNRYQTTSSNVYAYSRKRGTNEVLVILNFTNAPVQFKFSGSAPTGTFTDYLKKEETQFTTQTTLTLPANGYAIYVK